jgi:glucoamylase
MQLDETSFPLVLTWKLMDLDLLSNFDPSGLVSAACGFLVRVGPITEQDRWEETGGFSPSTLAINIAGLISAGQVFRSRGEEKKAIFVEEFSDYLYKNLEKWTVCDEGTVHPEVKRHFIRINPSSSLENYLSPDEAIVSLSNQSGESNNSFEAKEIVDAGFLELVRYGIYPAGNQLVIDSLKVIDAVLKFDTKSGALWRRYPHDGYGQNDDGSAYDGTGVGRSWPLLAGERAHYEIAAGRDVESFIQTMEACSSNGGPIPEQIWDGEDNPSSHLLNGAPTGSAMPLAWAHAEYLKILRSVKDKVVFDLIPAVSARYVGKEAKITNNIEIWRLNWQVKQVDHASVLRIIHGEAFTVRWSSNSWVSFEEIESVEILSGTFYADLIVNEPTESTVFTLFFHQTQKWIESNFAVSYGQK